MMLLTITTMLIHLLVFISRLNKMYKNCEKASQHECRQNTPETTQFSIHIFLFMTVLNAEQQGTLRKCTFHAGIYTNGSNCNKVLLFVGKNVFFREARYLWKTLLWYSRGLCLPVYLFMRSLVFGDALLSLFLLLILVLFLTVLSAITGNGCTEMKMYLLNFKTLLAKQPILSLERYK